MTTTRAVTDGPPPDRRALGRRGEDVAAEHLAARGLTVIERNWRCREGELDLVAAEGDRLVVAEVKTRSGTGFGLPAEAVTRGKAARIRRLAQRWLAERHAAGGSGFAEVRFDVLAVLVTRGAAPQVEHYEGAF
ncbi:YraN family protein [Actinomycetospora lutea]|uniref:YraN family protein n=1 Tax=Actinomycetospora lutea TaxID=663604 RepID=UPI002365BE16|nr:YraN family protein [Actinomycetospora lutea]MDD7941136.1 YraN family protein [Actinomycetospora lutea]